MKETKWIWIKRVEAYSSCAYFDEYVNEEETLCKQVWHDGYEEIFEIG